MSARGIFVHPIRHMNIMHVALLPDMASACGHDSCPVVSCLFKFGCGPVEDDQSQQRNAKWLVRYRAMLESMKPELRAAMRDLERDERTVLVE